MKRVLVAMTFLINQTIIAQNVGIGTATPLSKLHLFSGPSGSPTNFSPLVVENNTNAYINILVPNANESGLLFGKADNAASGGIIYNNANTPNGLQFRTNANIDRMVITSTGNVGIGTISPGATLDVRRGTAGGGTAQFFGTQNITHINLGTDEDTYIRAGKNNRFVILNDIIGGRVAVGGNNPIATLDVARGNAFEGTAVFRGTTYNSHINYGTDEDTYIRAGKANCNVILNDITGGKVGIGTSSPQYMLDVAGRGRIRSDANTAGIYFNSFDNSVLAGFVGMEADNYIGFWGNPIGWNFSMNTQTGALKINGSEGQPGQILRSNGGGSSPTWMNKPYVAWYNQSSTIQLQGSVLSINIPNVNGQVLTLSQPSLITYQFTIPLYANNGSFGGGSSGIVNIQFMDAGNNAVSWASSEFSVGNLASHQVIVTGVGVMPAGSFTIVARVARNSGGGNISSNAGTHSGIPIQNGQLIVQVFPQ
jgi:hypothetical protein